MIFVRTKFVQAHQKEPETNCLNVAFRVLFLCYLVYALYAFKI